ncbi:ATP-binding cassette G42 [Hibiscus trionum]|uniref:ATP-binding cassette G42 n=1 Tax=Hibiscus trionum TaxID=183268 RepID=A0A9W7JAT1_HIBTR|nr:ATP-binding cassette G42 [Hibiscus trionum]
MVNDIENSQSLTWNQAGKGSHLVSSSSKGKGVMEGVAMDMEMDILTKLPAPLERRLIIDNLIKNIQTDNFRLLQSIRQRLLRVGVKLPTVEVRYKNLHVEAECDVVHGKPLPTLWNSLKTMVSFPAAAKLMGSKSQQANMCLISDASGIIKPGRMTLLLGPPGCGKTTLLKALSGNLDQSHQVTGEVSYNGYKLEEFVPQKTCAYISQNDFHISEMTVRETLDFSAHCQGVGSRAEMMMEVSKREAEAGIVPDPVIDTYMQATSVKGTKTTLQTDYILKILGLDICAETFVGDALRRGISGGQKKRLSTGEIVVACMSRELLLLRRNSIFYVFKITQLVIVACITMTVFYKMDVNVVHANYYLAALFFTLMILVADEFPEVYMTVSRLPAFYKQKMLCFYPAWAYAIPAVIVKLPMSFLQSLIWTSITYFVIGYTPEVSRFFRQFVTFFAVQLAGISLFRFVASIFQKFDSSVAASSLIIFLHWLFCGFIVPQPSWPGWMKWLFWVSPMSYAEIALSGNELLAPRWQQMLTLRTTIGQATLESRGLNFDEHFFWIAIAALFGFAIVYNIGFTLALGFLKSPGWSRVIISREKPSKIQAGDSNGSEYVENGSSHLNSCRRMVLPFEPLTLTFQDVQYYIDTPSEMRKNGYTQRKLQLLSNVTGALRPASLRLASHIDPKTRAEFVNEVLEIMELNEVKDALVGIPGLSGLSTAQRKRLTIAVELVANPSIIFMDEPTSSLDARAAAIVMRAVKNVADTGRTIICTIHQPSIDIFEAFDELILLKNGGSLIYFGPLGQHSCKVIEYFESIPGVPKIKDNCNPASWMLEVTSPFVEAELGADFAEIYKNSALYENNKELVRQLSDPPPDSRDLHFPTQFSQSFQGQFKSCLWKLHLSYWRSPSYNLTRLLQTVILSLAMGLVFWNQGQKINNQQNLFSIFGSMYAAVIFLGMNSSSSVQPFVATERVVMYRERFAGMYSSWVYALAQVTIEVPYLFIQALVFELITYPMIGYYGSAYKILWYFYAVFCTQLYFTFFGMLFVSLTPEVTIAGALLSAFHPLLSLFSGFLIPPLEIPRWWTWMYYLMPISWTLNCLLTSQYGDVNDEVMVFGEAMTVASLLETYFGFRHDRLPITAIILISYPLILAILFAFFLSRLNFERR